MWTARLTAFLMFCSTAPIGCDAIRKVCAAEKIETRPESRFFFLQQDAQTHRGVNRVAEVVERMRLIDTSSCPTDFRTAYLDHLDAWQLVAEVDRQAVALNAEAHSDGMMAESVIRGGLGDPLGTFQEIRFAQAQVQQNYQTASLQIRQAFQCVEQLAIKYGATIQRQ